MLPYNAIAAERVRTTDFSGSLSSAISLVGIPGVIDSILYNWKSLL